MSQSTVRPATAAALAAAVVMGGPVLAGCAAGHAVTKGSHPVASSHVVVRSSVAGNGGALGRMIAKLQAAAATPFEAEYMAGGIDPPFIVYAVRPPDGLLVKVTTFGGKSRRIQFVVNGSGAYLCRSPGTGPARWTCQQLDRAGVAAQQRIFGVYTAAHWAAYLKTVRLAAGTKATTARAYALPTIGRGARDDRMSCIDFRPVGAAAGFRGIRTICAAAPGVLGSVMGCYGPTIVMGRYITSPSASLFQLPPGAKVIGQGAQQPRAA